MTAAAGRMACLLGVQQSLAKAELALAEVAGWELDDNTIRQLCHATAARASAGRAERATAAAFAQAEGDLEVQLDAGKANTLEGWRDVKAGVFARRPRGVPTTAADWDERDLPAPAVRSVVAAVEEASTFGERCAAEARRLGLIDSQQVGVLGDGAEWVWNLAAEHFAGCAEVLDIWHGAERLAEGAKAACGPGSPQAQAQARRGKERLLADGYWGGDGVGGRVDGSGGARRRRGGAGRGAELLRGPPGAAELGAAVAPRPVDRQRAGGGLDQAVAE